MPKPSPWGKGEQGSTEQYVLERASIKRVWRLLDKKDAELLIGRAEQVWSDVVELNDELERVLAKTTDPQVQKELSHAKKQIETLQAFAFNLTEY